MTILYTPIDIEFDMPGEAELINWHANNNILDHDYKKYVGYWHDYAAVAIRNGTDSWRSSEMLFGWINKREIIKDAKLVFNPDFASKFPGLVDLINKLPFEQIGAVAMMKQLNIIGPHKDSGPTNEADEPRRYLVYLTNPKESTFYLTDGVTKVFPTIDEQYRCFAFDNTLYDHGADIPTNDKIILLIAGFLDPAKHTALVERSVSKFTDKVVYEI